MDAHAPEVRAQINLAQRCLANGYPLVPILRPDAPAALTRRVDGEERVIKQAPGKQPHGLWARKEEKVYRATAETIAGWARLRDIADSPGLGIACGRVGAADVDIYEAWL